MLYLFQGYDKIGALSIRIDNRDAHLQWLHNLGDTVKLAGPTFNLVGEMNGSVVVFEMPSQEALEQLLAGDPYAQAGLFERSNISAYKIVINQL